MNNKIAVAYIFCGFLILFSSKGYAQLNQSSIDTIKSFFDGFISESISKQEISGASAVLIYKDSILLIKGYGFADVENKSPVDPHKTRFRIGSVTKIFTSVAILQLHEQGLLNVNDPVSKHLKFFNDPLGQDTIRIKHLLTHSAGFAERYMNVATRTKEDQLPLDLWLRKYALRPVYPTGAVFSYSNYSYALLGGIIEKVSGKKYEQYIQEQILDRLNMSSTLLGYDKDEVDLAKPYRPEGDGFKALDFDYSNIPPAGSIFSTAEDMASFLKAHIKKDVLLNAQTFDVLHNTHFKVNNNLNGFAFSFFERRGEKTDIRSLSHGGGWRGFNAYFIIIPELQLGYFVATNTENPSSFVDPLASGFIKTVDEVVVQNRLNKEKAIEKGPFSYDFEGSYRHLRLPDSDLTKLFFQLFFLQEKQVDFQNNAIIVDKEIYSRDGDIYISDVDKSRRITFRLHNNILYLFSGVETFKKIPFNESKAFLFLKLCLLIMLLVLLSWPFWNRISLSGAKTYISLSAKTLLVYSIVLVIYVFLNFERILFYGVDQFLNVWLWLPLISIIFFFFYLLKERKKRPDIIAINIISYGIILFLLFDFNWLFFY